MLFGGARSSTRFTIIETHREREASDVRDIRVATVQFQHAPSDKAYNLGRVQHFVAEATKAGVEIIAFPEMCLTGYWHVRKLDREAFEALAEPIPSGSCARELMRLSLE